MRRDVTLTTTTMIHNDALQLKMDDTDKGDRFQDEGNT